VGTGRRAGDSDGADGTVGNGDFAGISEVDGASVVVGAVTVVLADDAAGLTGPDGVKLSSKMLPHRPVEISNNVPNRMQDAIAKALHRPARAARKCSFSRRSTDRLHLDRTIVTVHLTQSSKPRAIAY